MAVLAKVLLLLLIVDKTVSSMSNTESVSPSRKGNNSDTENGLHYFKEADNLIAVQEQSSDMFESNGITCPTWHILVNTTGTWHMHFS